MAECTKNLKPQIKHDWYQTEATVVVTVLIKNVSAEHLKIDFYNRRIDINVRNPESPESDEISLNYNLSHKIVPEECSYKLTPSKIEVKLKKLEGLRWQKLEGDVDDNAPKEMPLAAVELSGPPTYPTSKKGKDWSSIERNIKEEENKEKPEGEEALQKLFQDIYGNGSDEVKKAMNKSYMESGGTVLSTNWNEIAKEKVEVKAPDGMEWKKW